MDACPCKFCATLGLRLTMSARAPYHMDGSDTVIYMCQKAQTLPGKGKATPEGIPCVRPQSDMRCYMLDRCGIESGSWQHWYQSLTACRITKPNWSKLSLEILSYIRELIVGWNVRLFLLLIPYAFWSESSYLSCGVKELGYLLFLSGSRVTNL